MTNCQHGRNFIFELMQTRAFSHFFYFFVKIKHKQNVTTQQSARKIVLKVQLCSSITIFDKTQPIFHVECVVFQKKTLQQLKKVLHVCGFLRTLLKQSFWFLMLSLLRFTFSGKLGVITQCVMRFYGDKIHNYCCCFEFPCFKA